jgi:hypothetical protein
MLPRVSHWVSSWSAGYVLGPLVMPSMGVACWRALMRLARWMLLAQIGEHLEFELAGELSHAGGAVGAHEFGGIGKVAAFA